jgi:tRNA pseudouridine13 synthase
MELKTKNEDFKVYERTGLKPGEKGEYIVLKLKKNNYTTEESVQLLSELLKIKRKNIGYAGSKDKNAVTEQFISVKNLPFISEDKILQLNKKIKGIDVEVAGYSEKPISLGDLKGNYFEINVNKLNKQEIENFRKGVKNTGSSFLQFNYFDEQRFSGNNVDTGRAILNKDYKKAVSLILKNKGSYETKIENYLEKKPNDYVGALKLIPKKTLSMFIHSFQSYIFNETLRKYMEKYKENNYYTDYSCGSFLFFSDIKNIKKILGKDINMKIPLVGFGTVFENNKIKNIVMDILKKEKLTQRNFIIREIPFISSEGSERNIVCEASEFEYEFKNEKKDKLSLKFFLPKGSYATLIVKSLIQNN